MVNVCLVLGILNGMVSSVSVDVILRHGAWVNLSAYGITRIRSAIANQDILGLTVSV